MPRATPNPATPSAGDDRPAWEARLAANLESVRARIERAALAVQRDPASIRLVAVTKQVAAPVARALVALGELDLGENRSISLTTKREALQELSVRWHFIGHLQRNKLRAVAPHLAYLHSLDSMRLLDHLAAADLAPDFRAFLQVKWSDEDTKTGIDPSQVSAVAEAASARGIALAGLMTMGVHAQADRTARIFASTAALANDIDGTYFVEGRPLLSMGMSGDLELAIQHGADWVRVGSDLYQGLGLDESGRPASLGGERS